MQLQFTKGGKLNNWMCQMPFFTMIYRKLYTCANHRDLYTQTTQFMCAVFTRQFMDYNSPQDSGFPCSQPTYLQQLGFLQSSANFSMHMLQKGAIIVYFLVYVDDILVIGNHSSTISEIITWLNQRFNMKNIKLFGH